jgi:hypothetical protein
MKKIIFIIVLMLVFVMSGSSVLANTDAIYKNPVYTYTLGTGILGIIICAASSISNPAVPVLIIAAGTVTVISVCALNKKCSSLQSGFTILDSRSSSSTSVADPDEAVRAKCYNCNNNNK